MNHDNGTIEMASGGLESVMNRSTGRRASRLAWMAVALAVAVAGAGCTPRPPDPPSAQGRAIAPAGKASLAAGPQCGGTDPHTKHIDLAVGCATCHPCGAQFGFDIPYSYPRGTTTAGGTLNRGIAPVVTTCTVACHSPMGAPARSVAWNAGPRDCVDCHVTSTFPAAHPAITNPTPTGADCVACHNTATHGSGTITLVGHTASWMDQANAGFHAFQANTGLGKCQSCHASDLSGGFTGFSCAQCHNLGLPAGIASWSVNCVMCHGGTNDQSGAPPKTTWGNAADAVRVGAHAVHLAGTATSPAVSCSACHVRPADAFAAGHIDGGAAEVTWGGMAVSRGASPAWNRGTATCSNTYCHGTFANGNAANAPVWTSTGPAACGSCHGLPPGGTHPSVSTGLTGCRACHPTTMDATGALVLVSAGGTHLDGTVQVSGGGHPAGWMDTASSGFHAYSANASLSSCQSCHGSNLDGVGGTASTSCFSCHGPGGPANDFGGCTACHGGTSNSSGAPPRATWGSTNPMAAGAHTSHVAATHAISSPLDCTACHPKPATLTATGHSDGTVNVSGYTGADPNLLATVKDPGWNAGTGTCATSYCHGSTLPGGSKRTPTWTVTDGSQVGCTGCHGNPPNTGRHIEHVSGAATPCYVCHPGSWNARLDIARHVNGRTEMTASSSMFGTFSNWSPTAVGAGTLRGTATGCHGGTYYWTGSPPAPRTGCN